MFKLAVLAALAITVVATADTSKYEKYRTEYTASKEYLHKQKLVYDVLFHSNQPQLKKDLYDIGQNYDLEKNIDAYADKEAVLDFLKHYTKFGILPHDAIYSVYYYPEQTLAVYKLLSGAKDFETFYKTALYLKNRINHSLFAYTFSLALIHRPDTQYIHLPPIYETTPYMFYNSELLEKAHHYEYFGLKENNSNGYESYIIPYNYSGYYLNDKYDYNYENLVNYLTEDIGWNEYYVYFRSNNPWLFNSSESGVVNTYRGEEYLYGHRQIVTRYNLERVANGLGKMEHLEYHGEVFPGYFPTMTYPNSLPFPVRPWSSKLPTNKQHYVPYAERYESRIMDAVDSGFVLSESGEHVNIYTPEGLNILGNIMEGNGDSYNARYYGNIDKILRQILGFSMEGNSHHNIQPSALEHFSTSLRDPAFYRIYFKLLHHYSKFHANKGPYKHDEIHFHDLELKSASVDKLTTYFEKFDSTVSHGMLAHTKKDAETVLVKARQYRLNHDAFGYNLTINAKEATMATIKVFIGPKYDFHGIEIFMDDYYFDYYYEIDNFVTDLTAGQNLIVRDHFHFASDNEESTEEYYDRVVKALESDSEFKYQKQIYSFPSRLLLPKGKPEGMPMQMFFYVAPVIGEPRHYNSRIFGEVTLDNRPFGFPLDRPVVLHDFYGPNMLFKEVPIYHRGN